MENKTSSDRDHGEDDESELSTDETISKDHEAVSSNGNIEEIIGHSNNDLNDEERLHLYEKGIEFKNLGSYQHALLCFLGCLRDLKKTSKFGSLPECLQSIADIYAKHDDYEKAVQFIQAAKLYYETVIVSSKGPDSSEQNSESVQDEGEVYKTLDEDAQSDVALRANEYEKLSHSCLKEKNIQLALEYCGKATHLRRKHYGDDHPISVKSLDLFTVIYAEMGKLQYSDAVSKFTSDEPVTQTKEPEHSLEGQTVPKETKKFDKENNDKNSKKSVRFSGLKAGEGEDNISQERNPDNLFNTRSSALHETYSDELSTLTFTHLVLFIIVSVMLAVLLTFAWCYYTSNPKCPSYAYVKLRLKYYYYAYIQSWFFNERYF